MGKRTREGVQVREVRRCERAKGRGSQVWVKERRDVDELACLTAALLRRSTAPHNRGACDAGAARRKANCGLRDGPPPTTDGGAAREER